MITSQQHKIIASLNTLPTIDVAIEVSKRVEFLKHSLMTAGAKSLVLGLSGGVDSTTAGKLAQMACDQLNLQYQTNDYQFIAVRLPYGVQADESDAQLALDFIQPNQRLEINIDAMVKGLDLAAKELVALAEPNSHQLDFSRGNNKARARMSAQYYVASLLNGLVIGTDHGAEAITGFFTKHGDGACDIAPLFGLNKRQVRSLAAYLGAPDNLVNKTPTADLEEHNPQQADEDSLGITYDQIDDYLEGKDISSDAQLQLEQRYRQTEHKRQGPVTLYCSWDV
ncbi:ammonia-dependent NAD(+) synthetase [Oceanospirillaceae bacterium]|jgi:NAD+ synthase|nr:ammonia-dependent NAD(+) synthetase [Oceanospirillaceae bacterium]MDB9753650.1 ammonia-dependent NAD(+) synthetase [Oceanospirillaceae bacterium]MDC1341072.1 ammonia-dependent NAD(+) synthetase [Oceanospirillaceae bacterium]|tara:strand:- start:236 stop:1081 length:846 start_codon:yes stop_codon:yes gene_type:complete